MSKNKFNIGDRVMVFQNSERIPCAACIGKTGTVIYHKCRDAVVEFDDGSKHAIWEIDLKKA